MRWRARKRTPCASAAMGCHGLPWAAWIPIEFPRDIQGPENLRAVPQANAKVAELIKKAACLSCHGENFAKPIDPSYPKIAGQHAAYLFVALKAYKTENNAKVGRSNEVMAGISKQFSNAELKAIAGYISSLEGELKTIPENRFR